jgi:predicted dehydrogenase
LDKTLSTGLIGEVGCHSIDQACWFLNAKPTAVTGWGSLMLWTDDGRDMPDTVQTVLEFPKGIKMMYDATLCSSFDETYDMFYGSDATLMMRDGKAWMFKEPDAPMGGWEVYFPKDTFYKSTGIALPAGGSKGLEGSKAAAPDPITSSPLYSALENFLRNANDMNLAAKEYKEAYGEEDKDGLVQHLSEKVHRRASAGYAEGLLATVISIKANEATLTNQRIPIKPEWYELA